jgi:hypothetical protein
MFLVERFTEKDIWMSKDQELVRAEGTIELTGLTTYMYGQYTLVGLSGDSAYALRSSRLDLDEYIGQYVEITGTRVPEYPLEGGPVFVDVETVAAKHLG